MEDIVDPVTVKVAEPALGAVTGEHKPAVACVEQVIAVSDVEDIWKTVVVDICHLGLLYAGWCRFISSVHILPAWYPFAA